MQIVRILFIFSAYHTKSALSFSHQEISQAPSVNRSSTNVSNYQVLYKIFIMNLRHLKLINEVAGPNIFFLFQAKNKTVFFSFHLF